ncbi:MAG: penicillin acylase family protein [candidate division NC10 bacterium]|nr:penicillin acylase family protein [candidate division NC10 bacterium]
MSGMRLARATLLASALGRRLLPQAWRLTARWKAPPLARLPAGIAIHRDECGVPFVEAGTLADLGHGLGAVMAQDRLWQMETMRRLAGGRLAEVLGDRPLRPARMHMPGSGLLAVDRLYRSLRMYPVARQELALLSADGCRLLQGFAEGVNGWLSSCPVNSLPPECLLLGFRPEPWRPEDSLAIGKLFGWLLSLAFPAKPILARLHAAPEVHWLLPPERPGRPAIVGAAIPARPGDLDLAARMALGLTGPGMGSNNWVLAGSRTASGKPLLCNDPHLFFELPAIWYPVVAATPEFRVAGGTLPGVPLVLLGRTPHLAWGCTAVMADDGDYYREALDPGGVRYRRHGGWEAIEIEEEAFRVRGRKAAARFPLRYVRHEGVQCPLLEGLPEEPSVSYRWVGFEPWPSLEAFLGAARARDVSEFETAMTHLALPAQNVVVADTAGTIAYFCSGRFPRRPSIRPGRPILDGTEPADAWQGYLDREEQPRAIDPPAGFLVTANNRLRPDLPSPLRGGFWEPPYRAARLTGILVECRQATAAEMARLQSDVLSLQALGLVSALVRPAAADLQNPDARQAAQLLLAWDGRMERGSAAAALYHLWYQALLGQCIRPRLEAMERGLFTKYLSTLHLAVPAVDRALAQGDPGCFPRGIAAAVEACLDEAWREARARLGPDSSRWQWGLLHRLTLRHALGRGEKWPARFLTWLFRLNRGPYPCDGDGMTINLEAFLLTQPFAVMAGPSYRQIVDLGRPEESCWIVAGGVSGDPRSVHYDDQIDPWLAGEYRPMRLSPGPDCARAPRML